MKKPWKFFLLTFVWSWLLWGICIIFDFGITEGIGMLFYVLGAIAPSSVGILLAKWGENKEYWKNFLNRISNLNLIKRKGYLVIFGLPPIIFTLAIISNYLVNGSLISFSSLTSYIANPLSLISFAIATLIGGPLLEEMGWRGYGLDHLTKNHKLISSALIVSIFWMVWHWPLFSIEGTLQSTEISKSLISILIYNIEIFSYGIIIVWMYSDNSRSILSAILFHFSINFYAGLIQLPVTVKNLGTPFLFTIAIVILLYWKKQEKSIKTVNKKSNIKKKRSS